MVSGGYNIYILCLVLVVNHVRHVEM